VFYPSTAVVTQVIYCDLIALGNISHHVDSMSSNALVPVFLCIIIVGVVDATGFKEYSPASFIGLNWEAVCSNDTERLLVDILVWIDVVQGKERLSLELAEGVELLRHVRL
jgi:hypothetical protein